MAAVRSGRRGPAAAFATGLLLAALVVAPSAAAAADGVAPGAPGERA